MESESYIKYSLWGGRFDMGCDELMKKFNESFSLDKRLWKQDIEVRKRNNNVFQYTTFFKKRDYYQK